MKYTLLAFLVICFALSCSTGRKATPHTSNKNTATPDTLKNIKIASDTLRFDTTAYAATTDSSDQTTDSIPPSGLRTGGVTYVTDTTAEAIMKALYYSTTGNGDSTRGITVKND